MAGKMRRAEQKGGPEELVLQCEIGPDALQEYAIYDTFVRRKRWASPLVFAVIFGIFATICFVAARTRQGGVLLGSILLAIGLGLPLFYIGSYLGTVRKQTRRMAKAGSKVMFTVRFDANSLTMTRGEQEQTWPWKKVLLAHRMKRSIAVYPEENQAFRIGGGEVDLDEAWNILADRLPAEKIK